MRTSAVSLLLLGITCAFAVFVHGATNFSNYSNKFKNISLTSQKNLVDLRNLEAMGTINENYFQHNIWIEMIVRFNTVMSSSTSNTVHTTITSLDQIADILSEENAFKRLTRPVEAARKIVKLLTPLAGSNSVKGLADFVQMFKGYLEKLVEKDLFEMFPLSESEYYELLYGRVIYAQREKGPVEGETYVPKLNFRPDSAQVPFSDAPSNDDSRVPFARTAMRFDSQYYAALEDFKREVGDMAEFHRLFGIVKRQTLDYYAYTKDMLPVYLRSLMEHNTRVMNALRAAKMATIKGKPVPEIPAELTAQVKDELDAEIDLKARTKAANAKKLLEFRMASMHAISEYKAKLAEITKLQTEIANINSDFEQAKTDMEKVLADKKAAAAAASRQAPNSYHVLSKRVQIEEF